MKYFYMYKQFPQSFCHFHLGIIYLLAQNSSYALVQQPEGPEGDEVA